GTQLFGITQDNYLAQCLVNGKDKAKIQPGQQARVTVITHKEITVPAEIAKVALLQDAKSHAYKIWIRLEKNDSSFTSGLFVRAHIELERNEGAIVVPAEYVKERDNRRFVQVVKDGAVCDAWVTTGIRQGTGIELTSGVAPGDLLIASEKVIARDQTVAPVETKME
ncbi:MAG TPA: hypothetical protein VM492_04355, partial [Sumerlaeia bacterium]|nr:hypothetical protein [Sumerlaeia bacterium]